MSLKFSIAAIFLLSLPGARPVGGQEIPSPQEWIQAANSVTDLSKLRPYTLQTKIMVRPGKEAGRLTVFQDKDRSRTELEFGNYRELRIVLGNREYVARNAQARPVDLKAIGDTHQLWRAGIISSDEIRPAIDRKAKGMEANCVDVTQPRIEVKSGWMPPREHVRYCFDREKKVLLLASTYEDQEPVSEVHYVNYQSFGGVQFPGAIRHFFLGKPSGVDFEDIQVTSLNPDSVSFSPPSNALELETCEDMQPARMIRLAHPEYPMIAKMSHIRGDVYFSARIGKDGALQDIKLLDGHPVLVQPALDAIKQWRYSPASCGSTPVTVETEITVRFHMY